MEHHGYREHLSTTTAMIKMMDSVATAVDQNLIASSMSIDQSAAFDCLEHNLLLDKLQYYSLDQNTMKWLELYLDSRSSYVSIGSATSSIHPQLYGVPQGSVMSPLLYLVYVNEFPTVTEDDLCENTAHLSRYILFGDRCNDWGTMTIYADDGQYLVTGRSRMNNQIQIEKMLDRIINYLNANGLEINQVKTTLSEFMCRQKCAKLR